ncbi:MAG: FHA domain-containing protein [Alphaproteobacteria bacterium]|nr:FHA domain-containing protein [Alphaproteobacteria bacterium]
MLSIDEQQFDLVSVVRKGMALIGDVVTVGFDAAPALMLGLVVLIALPFLIVGGLILRRVAPDQGSTSRFRGGVGSLTSNSDSAVGETAEPERDGGEPVRAFADAMIVIESDVEDHGSGVGGFRFGQATVVRIGREEDNEIRLKHSTVHRYHALIRRSFEEGYEISDLSDEGGNGVLVNGAKVLHGPLYDGDVISLGAARLRFDVAG